jgi:hypothetical protein
MKCERGVVETEKNGKDSVMMVKVNKMFLACSCHLRDTLTLIDVRVARKQHEQGSNQGSNKCSR